MKNDVPDERPDCETLLNDVYIRTLNSEKEVVQKQFEKLNESDINNSSYVYKLLKHIL